MGYKSLINKSVSKLFMKLKDLATDVSLRKVTVGDFDFSTKTLATSTASETTAKVVFLTTEKRSSNRDVMEREVILKFPDIVDLTRYDAILHGNDVWKMGEIIVDNGFIYTLKVYKGA